ncbi:beta-L-arabinofuranosidase domain-containing protein [Streptomyces sp. QL37]|uniref:beta-L-arabinofuranosidase domain-containing protein n=1 Tax=Streptomyces sp. QL37 TaxID=2093747 RepID=UPI000CF21C56|nr:beta-L-arabinofuranosidase domain-containing protein [Streptomyces sp. QL37]PPQ57507.1 hypothetical protein C5F59_13005 [Streptomyces sp. QL37]
MTASPPPQPYRPPTPSRRQVLTATAATTAVLALSGGTAGAASGAPPNAVSEVAAAPPALAPLPLGDVRLLDSPFRENMRRTCAYLLFVDPDRLLHTFRLTVGLASDAEPCGGWEAPDVQLRGHTTGHLLSALAQAHAHTGEEAYAAKARHIVAALAECQAAAPAAGYRPGYLSAFPEEVFDQLEAGGKPWAPYYTLHKVMAGLLDQYLLCEDAQALDVLRAMAGWIDGRTGALPYDRMQALLKVEFGGMNEVLTNLFLATGDPAHLVTARRFDHEELYGPLAAGRDELAGRHANTEIAKIVGASRSYEATGERRYRDIATYFWKTVVADHSYAIGGNSNQELFGPPGEIVSRLSEDTCENCNSYNMLKLGRQLFLHDPDTAAYMDHYEWTLINQLLAEQDPDSAHGFVTYYTGLWAGSRRQPKGGLGSAPGSYSSDYDNFSCDHGTGLETHTKFADSVYFRSADGSASGPSLHVNLYIPSEVHWREQDVSLRLTTPDPAGDLTRLTVTGGGGRFALRLRIPGWLADGHGRTASVRVNGRPAGGDPAEPGTYFTINRTWKRGDTVELHLPRVPVWRPAPDNPQVQSVSYGPHVLAGAHGDTAPATIPLVRPGSLRPATGRPGGAGEFTVLADGQRIRLLPFHRVHHQNYSVYWAVPPGPSRPHEVVRHTLDEGVGTTSADRTGSFPPARLAAGATWTAQGPDGRGAVSLDGAGGHVVLPPSVPSGLDALTVSVRVRLDSLADSARVFDLGYHKGTYLFLTPRTGAGKARAALKISGMEGEDVVDAAGPLPTGRWIHVALTIGAGTAVLYVDGAEAGRNPAMTQSPLLLGASTRNYLGRSQNSTHPALHGAVADFRLHNRALTAAQVAAL